MNKELQNLKTGFFVAFKDEAEIIEKEGVVNTVNIGRYGVWYDEEKLKNCLQGKKIKDAYIVEINVHPQYITHCNGTKFGIKRGNSIPAVAVKKIS